MWVKKITCEFTNVQYHFFSLMWIKKITFGPTICNTISFLHLHKLKKPLTISQMCNFSFFFIYVKWKTTCGPQVCNTISFLLLRELKKPFVNLQMCNIIFFTYVKLNKPFASMKMYNIIAFLHLCENLKISCGPTSVQYQFIFYIHKFANMKCCFLFLVNQLRAHKC